LLLLLKKKEESITQIKEQSSEKTIVAIPPIVAASNKEKKDTNIPQNKEASKKDTKDVGTGKKEEISAPSKGQKKEESVNKPTDSNKRVVPIREIKFDLPVIKDEWILVTDSNSNIDQNIWIQKLKIILLEDLAKVIPKQGDIQKILNSFQVMDANTFAISVPQKISKHVVDAFDLHRKAMKLSAEVVVNKKFIKFLDEENK